MASGRGSRFPRAGRFAPLVMAAIAAVAMLAALAPGALAAGGAARAARGDSFVARGSAEQAYATGVPRGSRLELIDRHGRLVESGRADSLGGILFRNVTPGSGYRILELGRGGAQSGPLTVMSLRSAPPSTGIYSQKLPTSGYGYLTTRDGTKLAIDVRLPAGPGPYPTLIEYSGYGYADPYNGPDSGSRRSRPCSASRSST